MTVNTDKIPYEYRTWTGQILSRAEVDEINRINAELKRLGITDEKDPRIQALLNSRHKIINGLTKWPKK